MPQFRFRAKTAEGKIRSGRVTAEDEQQARQRMEEHGLTVLEMSEGPPEGVLVSSAKSSFLSIDRVEAYFPPTSLVGRLAQFSSRRVSGYRVALLLVVIGLIWGGQNGMGNRSKPAPPPPARGASEMASERFSQVFSGRIRTPVGCDLNKSSLELSFPEIPCQFSKGWNQLEHPAPDQFVWKLEFLAAQKPTRCSLQVHLAGFHLSKPAPVALEPAAPEIELSLEPDGLPQ